MLFSRFVRQQASNREFINNRRYVVIDIPAGENTCLAETKGNQQRSVSYQEITVGLQRKRLLVSLFERAFLSGFRSKLEHLRLIVGLAVSAISLPLLEILQGSHIFLFQGEINTCY